MSTIKNLMKMVYINRLKSFTAHDIIVKLKSNDIMSLDLEMLGSLRSLVETERRFAIEPRKDGSIKIKLGDTYQREISLDDLMIDDESVFNVSNHYIRFYFDLDESVRMKVIVAAAPLQLTDIYVQLQDFQNEINDLCNSPFATAGPCSGVFFNLE